MQDSKLSTPFQEKYSNPPLQVKSEEPQLSQKYRDTKIQKYSNSSQKYSNSLTEILKSSIAGEIGGAPALTVPKLPALQPTWRWVKMDGWTMDILSCNTFWSQYSQVIISFWECNIFLRFLLRVKILWVPILCQDDRKGNNFQAFFENRYLDIVSFDIFLKTIIVSRNMFGE